MTDSVSCEALNSTHSRESDREKKAPTVARAVKHTRGGVCDRCGEGRG